MKRFMIAAAMLALTSTAALANPCTGTNITNCNAGTNQNITTQNNNQSVNNSNKAYGGNAVAYGGSATAKGYGGAGGAGGAGGSANQSQSQSNTVTSSNNNSNANSATANNQGNNQSVNIDSGTKQVGAIAVALAASGPCTGAAGGAAIGTYPLTIGFNYISESDKCNQRELIRISQASTNLKVRDLADKATIQMFANEFPNLDSTQPTTTSSTSATPAAILPQQTADASAKPRCSSDNLPPVTKMALGCQ